MSRISFDPDAVRTFEKHIVRPPVGLLHSLAAWVDTSHWSVSGWATSYLGGGSLEHERHLIRDLLRRAARELDRDSVWIRHRLGDFEGADLASWLVAAGLLPDIHGLADLRTHLGGLPVGERAAYFARFDDEGLAAMAAADSMFFGNLAGFPPKFRVEANRISMRARVEAIEAGLAALESAPQSSAVMALMHRQLSDERDSLRRILDEEPDRNFLVYDWRGDGRMAEIHGSLEADRIVAVVPGMNTDKWNFEHFSAHGARVQSQLDPGGDSIAVVSWLGYDTPEGGSALSQGAANEGGEAFREFVGGLRATGASHVGVIAHSYGSVVVAKSTKMPDEPELEIDSFVAIGSPGLTVGDGDELRAGMTGDTIVVGVNEGDVVVTSNYSGYPDSWKAVAPSLGAIDRIAEAFHGSDVRDVENVQLVEFAGKPGHSLDSYLDFTLDEPVQLIRQAAGLPYDGQVLESPEGPMYVQRLQRADGGPDEYVATTTF